MASATTSPLRAVADQRGPMPAARWSSARRSVDFTYAEERWATDSWAQATLARADEHHPSKATVPPRVASPARSWNAALIASASRRAWAIASPAVTRPSATLTAR